MPAKRSYDLIERLIYIIIWWLIFIAPLILSSSGDHINWYRVRHDWMRIIPFLLMFLINNQLLFNYFKSRHYTTYFTITAVQVVSLSLLGAFDHLVDELLNLPRPMPPHGPPQPENMIFINKALFNLLIGVLVIGLNNAIKIGLQWVEDIQNYEKLQKENLKTELAFLKHQISPHFLMNTLNNIHALVNYDKEVAQNSIVKLSKLMRVMLYESESEEFTLQKEVSFLNDYIELMKLRVSDEVDIQFNHPASIPGTKLPPLLLISFVENAFKHGIKAQGKSFIHINLKLSDNALCVNISNSKAIKSNDRDRKRIGIENSIKRLNLTYGQNYSLDIQESEDDFHVNIKIPLS